MLLVIDDVWDPAQLRPFRFGAPHCTRLVTTRIPELLPDSAPRIPVDAMSHDQARQMVADGAVGLPADAADRLATLAGRWPVLLNLVNGALRRRVARGQTPEHAAAGVAHKLAAEGPVAFDPARPTDRGPGRGGHRRGEHGCRDEDLAELLGEPRWVEAKIARFGSVVAVEADLALVDTPVNAVMRRVLRQSAHLLGPIDPPAALGATLASRLHGVPELREALDRYRATLPRPLLEPFWPMTGPPGPTGPVPAAGHTGGVTSCAFSPDGELLATVSRDGTLRLWHVATRQCHCALRIGHSLLGVTWHPDGTMICVTGGAGAYVLSYQPRVKSRH